jgi:hypothetical protein
MNEAEHNNNQGPTSGIEIKPLTPEQHAVTPVPKFTTELPFFYLTKHKISLQQDIRYEGLDGYGNPIRWEVIPNRSPKIGAPSIEAHEIFTRLVKPSMELHRAPDGQIPEILPLGGVRECLRIIGWKEGGWEARGLLQGLMQIGQASCESDFLLPIGMSPEGTPTFRAIKGIFNRFSIWKIGSAHVSEEDIVSGAFKFDFDLDDTLYIQLHRIERDIQRSQDQRYLDNAYMFAIGAGARRWYELLAAKIFGVVKNGGEYCEVKYSWYVKHHHTLKKARTRSRVVWQMNRVVSDHLHAGFIVKVEYRVTQDEEGHPDFLIRYYPGRAAKESVRRVLSFINSSTLPIIAARRRNRRAKASPLVSIIRQSDTGETQPISALNPNDSQQVSDLKDGAEVVVDGELLEALTKREVMRSGAVRLLTGKSSEELARVQDYVDYWDSIRGGKQPGLLVSLIQQNDPLPLSFITRRQRQAHQAEAERRQRDRLVEEALAASYEKHREAVIEEYISTALQPRDFDLLVEAEKELMFQQADLWARMSPERVTAAAQRFVRGKIAKGVATVSLEDYRRQELPRILAELALNPAELGIELDQTPVLAPDPSPNAQNDAPLIVSSQDLDFSNSNDNSSPGVV